MAIELAPAALERIRGYLAADPQALGLRFGVRRTGCSGWGYLVELALSAGEGDTVFEQDGLTPTAWPWSTAPGSISSSPA